MKKYMPLLILLTTASFSSLKAQDIKNIPANVKSEFEKRYPDQQAKWVREKNTYIAEFTEHGKGAIVHFNKQGQLTQREWYIILSELPEAAVIYLNKYYPVKSYTDAYTNILKCENMKGSLSYKVRLKGKEMVFNGKGIFIKKEKQRD